MSKGLKIFLNIIYYAFTFFLGIVLAVMLPNILYYNKSVDLISDSIRDGAYEKALEYIEGYHNNVPIFEDQIGDGKIVVFEAVTTYEPKDEVTGETLYKVSKSYIGFMYGVKSSYQTSKSADNQTKIKVTDSSDKVVEIEILDYDSNSDDTYDSISTLVEKDFFFFTIAEFRTTDVKKAEFIDRDGLVFYTLDLDKNYSDSDFFNVADAFINEYNIDCHSSNLAALGKQITDADSNYMINGSDSSVMDACAREVAWIVVVYFILIYLLGDSLIGKRYFIKLIMLIVDKIRGKKPVKYIPSNEHFGNDFYSQVTIKLDVSDVPELKEAVTISYSNDEGGIEFPLLLNEGYTLTKRVKSGVYVNPWVNINDEYEAINAPENLVVNSYKLEVTIKIEKIKSNGGNL